MNSLTTSTAGTATASVWQVPSRVWWILSLACLIVLSLLAGYLAATGRGLFAWLALAAALLPAAVYLVQWARDVSSNQRSMDELGASLAWLDIETGMSFSLEIGYWLAWAVLLGLGAIGGVFVLRNVAAD